MILTDTVAVVTGASEGIGRATAATLIDAGAHVYGLARSQSTLLDTADALGDRFTPVVCDVTDASAVREALDQIARDAGRLDIVVNNAGVGRFSPVDETTDDEWALLIDTNLTGAFYVTRASVPHLKAGGGHIVNVGSIAGIIGNAGLSTYNATKFGLRGFTEAIMKELRPAGIKVTYVAPGSVATGFAGTPPKETAIPPDEVAAAIRHVLEAPDSTLISEVVLRPMNVG